MFGNVLYEDENVTITETCLILKNYLFPVGSKIVAYSEMEDIQTPRIADLEQKNKIKSWGPSLDGVYWQKDTKRSERTRAIVLQLKSSSKSWFKVGFSVDDKNFHQVYDILVYWMARTRMSNNASAANSLDRLVSVK